MSLSYDRLFTLLKSAANADPSLVRKQENNTIAMTDLPRLIADAFGWPSFPEVEQPKDDLYYALSTILIQAVSSRDRGSLVTGEARNLKIAIPGDFKIYEDDEDYLGKICIKNRAAFESKIFRWR